MSEALNINPFIGNIKIPDGELKPFKGWWPDLATLKAAVTAIAGDYAYVADASPATTISIYVYDATAPSDNYWADSGRDVDASDVQTFETAEQINDVSIINDLNTGGEHDVLSAEQGKVLGQEISQLDQKTQTLFDTIGTYNELEIIPYTNGHYIITNQSDGYIPNNGTEVTMGDQATWRCAAVSVTPGQVFVLNNYANVSNRYAYVWAKNTFERITTGSSGNNHNCVNEALVAPTDAKWLILNDYIGPNGIALKPLIEHTSYKGKSLELNLNEMSNRIGAIEGKKITVNDIEPTEFKYFSTNICDPDEVYAVNGAYVKYDDGNLRASGSSSSGGYTGYIQIDERGLYCNHVNSAGSTGWATYKAATAEEIADDGITKHTINGSQYVYCYGGQTQFIPYHTTNGTPVYARFTINRDWSSVSEIMVNSGQTAIPFENYAGKTTVISKEILPYFLTETQETTTFLDGIEVVLPSEIVVTKTDVLQLFYRDIITAFNPYNFDVECICSVGTPYPRYFEYKPANDVTTPSTFTLTVNVYDNAHRIVSQGTTSIKVIANATSPSNQTNIMLLGASTLADGTIVNEVNRRLCLSSGDGTPYNPTGLGLSNINFVGRTTTSTTGVNQESQSGWTWGDYATVGRFAYRFYVVNQIGIDIRPGAVYSGNGSLKFTVSESDIDIDEATGTGYFTCTYSGSGTQPASGTLNKYSGEGDTLIAYDSWELDSRNPFWDDVNNELDFSTYISTYCGGSLDILVSYLGINDIFTNNSVEYIIENYVKPFIRALHTQSPSTKVIICNLHIPSPFGGMGTSYGASAKTYWNKCVKFFDYVKELKELESDNEFSGYVTVCSTFQEFDSENLYPMSTSRKLCNRSENLGNVQTNGMHPSVDGKKAIADSIYHKITQQL